jgi:hypothetical protein
MSNVKEYYELVGLKKEAEELSDVFSDKVWKPPPREGDYLK